MPNNGIVADNEPFALFQGEYKEATFTIEDNIGPKDLTGCTVKWALSKMLNGALHRLVLKTSDDPGQIQILDPQSSSAKGQFNLYLQPEDTASLTPGDYYYHQASVTDQSTSPRPEIVTYGNVSIKANATL